ncbi:MAG: RsmG family class I SAM-dependent methyltransferase [Ilumatobacteraceae bacterium]
MLAGLQDRGAIGTTSLDDAVAHADRYVALLPDGPASLADLGSGGGLPGLVIAVRRPDLSVVLVERRLARADQLRRAVSALAVADRVSVHADDVRTLATVRPHSFDVVTARSFAAPPVTAAWAGRLLRVGGILLVSEPPVADDRRWPVEVIAAAGLEDHGVTDGVRRFTRLATSD